MRDYTWSRQGVNVDNVGAMRLKSTVFSRDSIRGGIRTH